MCDIMVAGDTTKKTKSPFAYCLIVVFYQKYDLRHCHKTALSSERSNKTI